MALRGARLSLLVALALVAVAVTIPHESEWIETGADNTHATQPAVAHKTDSGTHEIDMDPGKTSKSGPGDAPGTLTKKKPFIIHHKKMKKQRIHQDEKTLVDSHSTATQKEHHKTNHVETSLVTGNRQRADPKQPQATNPGKQLPAHEKFARWVAEKLDMRHTNMDREPQDKDCRDAPKMTTALVLQIILGPIGVGFAYMGRWDWFSIALCVMLAPIILLCFINCICPDSLKFKANKDTGSPPEEDAGGMATLVTLGACCSPLASVIIWIWGIVAIANKSLDCGNGCVLQDSN